MTTTDFATRTPLVLGAIVATFLAMFALDSYDRVLPSPAAAAAVVVHLLPALIVVALVIVGWYRPLVGAIGFFAAAAAYAFGAPRLDWIAAIAGPLVIVGAAFLWSWTRQPRTRGQAG